MNHVELIERYNIINSSMQGIENFPKDKLMHTEMARDYDALSKERDELWEKINEFKLVW